MLGAREIFDAAIDCTQEYCDKYRVDIGQYLGVDATISILSKPFEKGVTKLERNAIGSLEVSELAAMEIFRKPARVVVNVEEVTTTTGGNKFFESLEKKRKANSESAVEADRHHIQYHCTSHVKPTSNDVERLFSQCKLYLTDKRKKLLSKNLDITLFLREHMNSWDAFDVEKVLTKVHTDNVVIAYPDSDEENVGVLPFDGL